MQDLTTFTIAVGKSRESTNWRNEDITWPDLLKRVSVTHVTHETYADYLKMDKAQQDKLKDVGGFVGGYIANGRRKATSVLSRQLLTLDLDHLKVSTADFWANFTLMYGCAAAVYSTHKHSPEAPRLRLLIPLDREVKPEEYEALGRKLAGLLGIDDFDDTTFQPSRLMYWPSTAKDGEFIYLVQDGDWLSADSVLSSYRDWADSTQWPISSRVGQAVKRGMLKQGDPLDKRGVVGAFCRTYGIGEAIEKYLSDVYVPCDVEGRYTFVAGSTAGGLVVYEDKFAYSHHGTDVISGKLCNAFDLVRLHKFGAMDDDSRVKGGDKLPSYGAMSALANKDPEVRKKRARERLDAASEDFAGVEVEEGEAVDVEVVENDEWLKTLETDKQGITSTINNAVIILKNDPGLRGVFALDQFENREIARRNLPWRKITPQTRYLTDTDDAALWHYVENRYGLNNLAKIRAALLQVLRDNGFHPIREYLEGLTWDGAERMETLLIDYMGAEDNLYTRQVTRKMLIAAVARVFQPGVKFDTALVLVGAQGQGKSQIIKRLGCQWFSDSFTTVQGKEAFEQIQGVWLVEMAELAGLRKAEVQAVKHFISKTEDRYRTPYGRRTENFSRQCVFFGTTNVSDFMNDATGGRRWWPVPTGINKPARDLFEELDSSEVSQIWAEAKAAYDKKEKLTLSAAAGQMAVRMQMEHTEKDEREGLLRRYLDTKLPVGWAELNIYEKRSFLDDELSPEGEQALDKVCAVQIWCEVLKGQEKDMQRRNALEIHEMMANMEGWERWKNGKMKFKNYGVQRAYVRKTAVFIGNQ